MDTLGRGKGIDLLRVVIVIHTVQSYFFFEFGVHSARFGKWFSLCILLFFSLYIVFIPDLYIWELMAVAMDCVIATLRTIVGWPAGLPCAC